MSYRAARHDRYKCTRVTTFDFKLIFKEGGQVLFFREGLSHRFREIFKVSAWRWVSSRVAEIGRDKTAGIRRPEVDQYGNVKRSVVRWYPVRSIKFGLGPRQGIRSIGNPDNFQAFDKLSIVKRSTAKP